MEGEGVLDSLVYKLCITKVFCFCYLENSLVMGNVILVRTFISAEVQHYSNNQFFMLTLLPLKAIFCTAV